MGKRPFSSHAWKKNVQSTYSRSSCQVGLDHAHAREGGRRQVLRPPVDRRPALARRGERKQGLALLLAVQLPQLVLRCAVLLVEPLAPLGLEQVGDDRDDARGVEDVQRRLAVGGRDLHRRVLARGGRAADQERQVEPAPLHLLGHVHHLVERGRDQPGEADDVAALLDRGVEDPVGRDHDAEVDDLVVVAAEDDADDVLADVVDVALDRGEHDLPARAAVAAGLLGLHERLQVGDGALHRPRALHHLRQEHLPGAEEVADDRHPVHQRPLDHVERPRQLLPRLFRVLLDEVDDPVDERVGEPLLDRRLAPGEVELALRRPRPGPSRANATMRSVASGRRLKTMSSTCSSRSGGMSS